MSIRVEKTPRGYFVYDGSWLDGFCWTFWGAKRRARKLARQKRNDYSKTVYEIKDVKGDLDDA